ncbi:MAG: LacI family transcriptional regulator [Clostridiales bacterium]|nr:LacI family transcriptional regulator [Clostridiales bacterium]
MGRSKTVTLRDIAVATGFSINTVSHALKEKPDISKQTRALIQKTAQEMGYIGNASASFLRSGISKTIAIILGDISNPHFSIMVREIETYIRELGYTPFILNTDEDEENEYKAILSAVQKNVDGIILCPVQRSRENIRFLQKTGVPFVLIGRRFAGEDADYVVCDDENGGYIAAKYLLELGHRDILFLNGPLHISSAAERLQGYQRAFKEMGVACRPELIYSGSSQAGGWGDVLAQALKQHPSVTALLAFSDLIAWESILALKNMGLRVPKDISVMGFDDIQSRFRFPVLLTTVSSSKRTMATAAAELLLKKIQEDAREQIVLKTKLIVRESTRAL